MCVCLLCSRIYAKSQGPGKGHTTKKVRARTQFVAYGSHRILYFHIPHIRAQVKNPFLNSTKKVRNIKGWFDVGERIVRMNNMVHIGLAEIFREIKKKTI